VRRLLPAALAASVLATPVLAGDITIDFEDLTSGTLISDQYASSGVLFTGDIWPNFNIDDFNFELGRARDLQSIFGGDDDIEGVSAGLFLGSSTIGFEVAQAGTYLNDVQFDVARKKNQDITVLALVEGQSNPLSHTFHGAAFWTGIIVEEFQVDLTSLFGDFNYVGVAIHNHGGTFGFDNITYSVAAIPTPTAALLGAGALAGLGATRRRHG